MDIQKLRQEFEKLPDIKGILYGSDFGFNESLNEYYHPDHTNHRLNYAFIMGAWMAWKTKAQAPEGFVLVPKELSDEVADELASDAFNNAKSLFDSEYRGYTALQREYIRLRWCKRSAKQYQSDYKTMIEAQEQSQ